jgi:hypothetical protein
MITLPRAYACWLRSLLVTENSSSTRSKRLTELLAARASTPRRLRDEWLSTLENLVDRSDLAGLLAGRIARLLRDEGRCDADATEVRLARALTVGVPAATSAGYVEGFLSGGGLLLVHDDQLLALVDKWLTGLAAETFTQVLPLLRRTFAEYAAPERRAIGERVRQGAGAKPVRREADGLDPERVAKIVPVLEMLVGKR